MEIQALPAHQLLKLEDVDDDVLRIFLQKHVSWGLPLYIGSADVKGAFPALKVHWQWLWPSLMSVFFKTFLKFRCCFFVSIILFGIVIRVSLVAYL